MAAKRKRPPPLFKREPEKDTPAKQHKRFLEMAKEIGASKDPKDFDKAFRKITGAKTP